MDDPLAEDLDPLLDEALPPLLADPQPLQAERLACLVGQPLLQDRPELAELAAVVGRVERRADPAAAAVLAAQARLFRPPLGPLAADAAQRLADAGTAPHVLPVLFEPIGAFVLESDDITLMALAAAVGEQVTSCTLVVQRGLEANLSGGVGALEDPSVLADRLDELRRGAVGHALQEPEPEELVDRMAEAFAWAERREVAQRPGLMLDRPLLALAVTGGPDPWGFLRTADEDTLMDELSLEAEDALAERRESGEAKPRDPARQRRQAAKAARKARRRNRRG